MSLELSLLEPARRELDEAIAWYAAQAPGLGDAFLLETLKVFRLMQRYPDAGHPLHQSIRRSRLSRFPYGVIYTVENETVLVLAIAHLHRKPGYWRHRYRVSSP